GCPTRPHLFPHSVLPRPDRPSPHAVSSRGPIAPFLTRRAPEAPIAPLLPRGYPEAGSHLPSAASSRGQSHLQVSSRGPTAPSSPPHWAPQGRGIYSASAGARTRQRHGGRPAHRPPCCCRFVRLPRRASLVRGWIPRPSRRSCGVGFRVAGPRDDIGVCDDIPRSPQFQAKRIALPSWEGRKSRTCSTVRDFRG